MITETLNTLTINKLSQKQYDKAKAEGRLDENQIYLTPAQDLSEFGFLVPSEGLQLRLDSELDCYCVDGIGTCTDTEVVIPSEYDGKPVKLINYEAFCDQYQITSIHIPDSITEIGAWAFAYCSSLNSLVIPDSVETIEESILEGCSSLESLTIPFIGRETTSVPSSSTLFGRFFGQTEYEGSYLVSQSYNVADDSITYFVPQALKSVVVTHGEIHYGAFMDCTQIQHIKLPEDLLSIPDYAFNGCSALQSIELHENIRSIGYSAFRACNALKTIVIPPLVSYIAGHAFYACRSLVSLVIPLSVTNVEADIVSVANSPLKIYCEGPSSVSDAWNVHWNGANAPVIWNYAKDIYAVNERLGDISTVLTNLTTRAQTLLGGTTE